MSSFSEGKIFPDKAAEIAMEATLWQYHIHAKWSFSPFPERDHTWSPHEVVCQSTFSVWHQTRWSEPSGHSWSWLIMMTIKVTIFIQGIFMHIISPNHSLQQTCEGFVYSPHRLTVEINRENSDTYFLFILPAAFPDTPTYFFFGPWTKIYQELLFRQK